MRRIIILAIVVSGLIAAWWVNNPNQISNVFQQYVENKEFVTLKARYTPEQIMEAHRKELIIDSQHTFQEPILKFHPYALMEVKYFQPDKKSREGALLWSMVDGEIVINTDTWEQTHGFEDAITAGATRNDFKLMQAIAKQKSPISIDQLLKDLHIEKDTLSQWIESALSKQLIIQKGNELQLHFQNPKILVIPETKMTDWLVKKPYNYSQRTSAQYSINQILKTAKAAFGEDFSVRNTSEVFLPVYTIHVNNPDGSVSTSYWNAVNGQRMIPRYSIKDW